MIPWEGDAIGWGYAGVMLTRFVAEKFEHMAADVIFNQVVCMCVCVWQRDNV